MKLTFSVIVLLLLALPAVSQQPAPEAVPRVPFVLKNTLGYHRMFRAEGPGIAYGFTMNRNEKAPLNWPVGTRLYFSKDGETTRGLIWTLTAEDAGKTLETMPREPIQVEPGPVGDAKPAKAKGITVLLRNNSLLPRRIAFISYRPDEPGNGTEIVTMWPFAVRKGRYPVGTKLYLANSGQIDQVMSGQRIDSDKPFLTVGKGDAFRIINIFE